MLISPLSPSMVLLGARWVLARFFNPIGTDRVKTDPSPSLEVASIFPPRACAKFWLILKPSPTPSLLRWRFAINLVKFVNNFETWAYVIPTPVSLTLIITVSLSNDVVTLTYPLSVYFMALLRRLIIIYLRREGSILMSGRHSSHWKISPILFSCA